MPDRLNSHFLPPPFFITNAMECPVMCGAQGHHPFVTDLAAEGAWLGKTQVMGMARSAATDETRL